MARYVILSFDDNSEADAFVAAVEQRLGVIFGKTPADKIGEVVFEPLNLERVFVRGLYMKPTIFCTCNKEGKWGRNDSWKRGTKFGLWVHNVCGKPSQAWAKGDHWYASLGKNLLPVSTQAPEWRGEGVSGHRFDQETKQWINVETGKVWDGKLPSGKS